MSIFRAYLQDAAGAVTWAAWIQAETPAEAKALAAPLCAGQSATLDLWWSGARDIAPEGARDAV